MIQVISSASRTLIMKIGFFIKNEPKISIISEFLTNNGFTLILFKSRLLNREM